MDNEPISSQPDNHLPILEEKLSREQLILEIARLRQEIDEVKQEKADLEILLETTTEHADTIEEVLHNQAESALRDSEKRLVQFLEAVPVGVFVVDASGRPYYANQTAQEILGKGIIPQSPAVQLPEIYQSYMAGTDESYPTDSQPLFQALKGNRATVDNIEIRQGNKIIPLEMWATPIFNETDQIVYAISAFQDITQRKQAEVERISFTQELEGKNAALQEMDKIKDEFLANTSHELRTPLNGIIGLAESLIEGATGELPLQTITNLEMIVSSGKRLAALVNDILDFAKLKHHNLELQLQPVGMREITDLVLRLSQPLVAQKPLQLINNISSELPSVYADENRVQQILHNLVSNAIKFTDSGIVKISAKILITPNYLTTNNQQPTTNNQQLAITISDTGIGIHENKLDKIFESFEQADGSTARQYGGAGLGLTITKRLIQLHGGEINVESTIGIGSKFTFTLPLLTDKISDYRQGSNDKYLSPHPISPSTSKLLVTNNLDTLLLPESVSSKQPLICTSNLTILIVDDELVNRQVLLNHLSLENYCVAQASNGIEALALIDQGLKPDLILLDVMMPRMTGYEVCRKIRENFPANELPILMLTAKNQVSDLVEGLNAGANDYLNKPISKNELLSRIKTHLEISKLNLAYSRFIPREFLQFLDKKSILDVQLGDQVQKEMSVLFSDIRDFTTLSESLTPQDNFRFINAYLSRMEPAISENHGFIDKYIGDAIMALFAGGADDAVRAGISMLQRLVAYNQHRANYGYIQIQNGIGINTGLLMLGTVGGKNRMDSTEISHAVNLASRLEELTKDYGVSLLISHQTYSRLQKPKDYAIRIIDKVQVKGKSEKVTVYEVFDADPAEIRDSKLASKQEFEEAIFLYQQNSIREAALLFNNCLRTTPKDRVAKIYLRRCRDWRALLQ